MRCAALLMVAAKGWSAVESSAALAVDAGATLEDVAPAPSEARRLGPAQLRAAPINASSATIIEAMDDLDAALVPSSSESVAKWAGVFIQNIAPDEVAEVFSNRSAMLCLTGTLGVVLSYVLISIRVYGATISVPEGSIWDVDTKLFLAYVGLALLMRFAIGSTRHMEYSPFLFTFCMGVFKLVVFITWHLRFDGTLADMWSVMVAQWRFVVLYSIPAALYFGSDVLVVVALWRVDPVTFSVLNQNLRDVIIVIVWQMMFQVRLQTLRLIGFGAIFIGIVLKEGRRMDFTNLSENPFSQAILMLVATAFLSGIAAVVNEKLLKDPRMSFALQNIAHQCYTLVLSSVMLVGNSYHNGSPVLPVGFTGHDTMLFSISVLAFACFGIVTALYLRQLGNMSRIIAHATIVVVSVGLQRLFYGTPISVVEYIGILHIMIGMGSGSLTEAKKENVDDEHRPATATAAPLISDEADRDRPAPYSAAETGQDEQEERASN